MKILHVMAGAETGGAETACIDMCLALYSAGTCIELATRKNPRNDRVRAAGITVHELPFGGALDFVTAWRLRKILKKFQPAIVQTWMSRAAQKLPRRPPDLHYKVISRLGGYYKLRHFNRTDFFTTITPTIAEFLAREGVARECIRHINNFADTETAGAPADRAALNTPANAPLLIALGRLHRAKAFDILLDALAQIPAAYLWIAGEGPERAALEQQTATLGLDHRVRFLGWRDDRAALFATCDACVFPSRYEPFGTVFVQAWAQGKPLIAAASDGPRAYIHDGVDGLLVPIDDAPALAAAITKVLNDSTLATQLVSAGRIRYEQEFKRERIVAAYLALYQELATAAATTSAT